MQNLLRLRVDLRLSIMKAGGKSNKSGSNGGHHDKRHGGNNVTGDGEKSTGAGKGSGRGKGNTNSGKKTSAPKAPKKSQKNGVT